MVTGYLQTLKSSFGILAWVVIVVFLVLCMLFWKVGKGLQWFGVSAVLTGGIFLFITRFFSNLSTAENFTGTDFESLPIASSTLQEIVTFTFSKMNLMPILFLVGGVILFLLGLVIHKTRNKAV